MRIQAVSIAGEADYSDEVQFSITLISSPVAFNATAIVMTVLFLLSLSSIAAGVAYYYRFYLRIYFSKFKKEDGDALISDEEPVSKDDFEMIPVRVSRNSGDFDTIPLETIHESPDESDTIFLRPEFRPLKISNPNSVRFFRPMSHQYPVPGPSGQSNLSQKETHKSIEHSTSSSDGSETCELPNEFLVHMENNNVPKLQVDYNDEFAQIYTRFKSD